MTRRVLAVLVAAGIAGIAGAIGVAGLHRNAMAAPVGPVAKGSSPQLAVDGRGIVRLVYGRGDTIFCLVSTDQGANFGAPIRVGIVPGMSLGNTRGPVIASSTGSSLVTATGTNGQIAAFRLDPATNQWARLPRDVNDVAGSAPEGLMTLAADASEHFYAVWLDHRLGNKNQIFATAIRPGDAKPSANVMVYAAPTGVCNCCRPSIGVTGSHVAIMFRNSLGGFRDLYLTTSTDSGATYSPPQKLGTGTWKFDACPMDGGAISVASSGQLGTVWRRENTIYFDRPGEAEVAIGTGQSPMMATAGAATYVIWQSGPSIKLRKLSDANATVIGEGRLPQVLALPDGRLLCAWENSGQLFARKI